MEIAFESFRLRTICENETEADKELGPIVGEILRRRLADIRAATSIEDLVVGKHRTVNLGQEQRLVVELRDDHKVVLTSNHILNPTTESGEIDWEKVNRLKVTHIGE